MSQWFERVPAQARQFVKELMNEDIGIVRRIVIHTFESSLVGSQRNVSGHGLG